MFSYRFCVFCLVSTLCICLCVGSSHVNKCLETEKRALVKLRDGFKGGKEFLSSWNGEDCCKWKGISCNNLTGHVTGLYLHLQEFSGDEVDSSLCELQNLTSLSLIGNYYLQGISNCIGSLGQLVELRLAHNYYFLSVIPPTLGNLTTLQTLDLGSNYGSVVNDLEWLLHLPNLRYLDLSHMNLSGAMNWLSTISKIPSLSELYLDSCGLPQVNPESIPQMNFSTSLKILSLSTNNLSSSTLSWVFNFCRVLTYLDLSFNSFHTISDDFANMISLQHLDLSYNVLHNISDGFANMISLQYLDLSHNALHNIPNGLTDMVSLQYLDLSYNVIEGSMIPKSSQSLCQLKRLFLHSNKLSAQLNDCIQQLHCAQDGLEVLSVGHNPFSSGPLPDFSSFSSLKTLYLRNTNVVGPIPQSFGHLPYLAKLDLSFNKLYGSLSLFEVSKLASLEELDLSHNQLNGTLPYSIGQLSNLSILSLSSNKLNGVINETHLSNLSRLQDFKVAENSLSFNLSSNWAPPFQLERLHASSCILGPKFPTWLKHQRKLVELQISNSSIIDSFPKWFWNLSSSLSYLNVSHNKLSGALPKSLLGMKTRSLEIWDLSFNNLSGPLPPFPEVYSLFLSNNMLSGSISSFCATSHLFLTYLDLSSNLLAGPLSDCWGKFKSLKVLNLAKNNLSGKIPNSFGNLQQIQMMHLNNNNFSGEIPPLTLCNNLKFIDFGDNSLQGILPTWIGNLLDHLIVLRLRANVFQGNIPTSLCNLSFLQVLDLSQNNITGEIPQCLSHIVALSDMKFQRKPIFYDPDAIFYQGDKNGPFTNTAILTWKGNNREYGKILGLMTIIDLSCNYLTGEIPQSMTKLVALAGLNLSGNYLTGFIPNNIGHMKMLESLDLSRNHLYGKMPTSFSNLSFLSYMNLSFNNLSGRIPQSTQLQSFDASTYEGNIELCGPPLMNLCPGDVIPPSRSPDKHGNEEDEDELITIGFYISLGLGFCIGFWGVCGTLVIKASWRHAYFQFFNNMSDWIHVTVAVFTARMKRKFQLQE